MRGSLASITLTGVPEWVDELFEPGASVVETPKSDLSQLVITARSAPLCDLVLTSCRLMDADLLDTQDLRSAIGTLYLTANRLITSGRAPHPIRIWQFIPDLHKASGQGLDRYMVFNQGRFDAFSTWFGGPESFARTLPAATAVGHDGRDLFVHFLSARDPGRPVENPRQRAAFEYSRRFGPSPPCFSRGTVFELDGAATLLIAGTASIRGEETMFAGDLEAQVTETLENLASLIRAASHQDPDEFGGALARVTTARVYVVDPAVASIVESYLRNSLPGLRSLEVFHALICRTGLLVEVEGTAELSGSTFKRGAREH